MNEKIIEQIRLILNKADEANNDSVQERATALKIAQKLMSKHRITEAMLASNDEADKFDIESEILYAANGKKLSTWRKILANAVCEANTCRMYTAKNRYRDNRAEIRIVGRTEDAFVARYMYNYIARQVDRLTKMASKLRDNPGKTWCNSFRLGAVHVIRERLEEAGVEAAQELQAEASGNSHSIVRVQSGLAMLNALLESIDEWMNENLRLYAHRPKSQIDDSAYRAGRRVGGRIRIDPRRKQSKQIGKPAEQLEA